MVAKLVAPADVVQVYRYPGLSHSAAKTLLRKVSQRPRFGGGLSRGEDGADAEILRLQARSKVTDAITAIDGEQVYNVGLKAQLTNKEAETLAWRVTWPVTGAAALA